jgi:hypothetical protein
MKFGGKNPALRVAAKRYEQLHTTRKAVKVIQLIGQ